MEIPESEMYREQPDRGPCSVFRLYKSTNKYLPEVDKSIRKMHRGAVCVVGVVVDGDLPEEKNKFVMHYHMRNEKSYFGSLSIEPCTNVFEQDGCYYFEGGLDPKRNIRVKYLLIPNETN